MSSDGHHHKRSGIDLFRPNRFVGAVTEVLPAELKEQGITGVILDLDNTLVRWHQEEMTEEIVHWLEALKSDGFKLCILSNSVLSKRSERIAQRVGCFNVRKASKPRRRGFRQAIQLMGTTPHTTAIVGDQLFTDILGGNRAGIYTILVEPMHKHEFIYTRLLHRPLEKILLKRFRRHGHI